MNKSKLQGDNISIPARVINMKDDKNRNNMICNQSITNIKKKYVNTNDISKNENNALKPNSDHDGSTKSQRALLRIPPRDIINGSVTARSDVPATISSNSCNSNNINTILRKRQSTAHHHHPCQPCPPFRSFGAWQGLRRWRVMVVMAVVVTPPAAGTMLDLVCSSLCRHGTCSYPVTAGNKPTVRCHCYPGWGGDHCTLPCSLPCANGRCIFIEDQQLCLCGLTLRQHNCSDADYDLSSVLSLAQLRAEEQGVRVGATTQSPSFPAPPPNIQPPPQPLSPLSSVLSSAPLTNGKVYIEASPPLSKVGKIKAPPTTTPLPKGKLQSPQSNAAVLHRQTRTLQTPAPDLDHHVTLSPEVRDARKAKRALLVALVTNPSDLVQQNVQKGASQCTSNFVCHHGGRCVAGRFGGFRCQCIPPYFGTFCEHSCPQPCLNGAHCLRVPQRQRGRRVASPWMVPNFVFRCVCPPGFSGPLCENHAVS